MVLALIAVAHLAQADGAGHVLQLAVAVGGAGEAVQRMVGDVELHHALADAGETVVLRRDLDAGRDGRGARFLSIGSANMNNRSMGYDTELNVAWDDVPGSALSRSIRAARANLLAEHTGLGSEAFDRLGAAEGLVDYLNGLADSGKTRLRHHPIRSASEEYRWLTTIFPKGLPFDSEIAREAKDKPSDRAKDSFLTKSLTSLSRLLRGWRASTG